MNSKQLLKSIIENAKNKNEGNAVPYFILLEMYLINDIKGPNLEFLELMK